MKENTEERRKRKRDDENFPSPTVNPASIPADEMTSSRCFELPNGRLSLHPPCHVRIVVILRIPPWRDKISVENHHDGNRRTRKSFQWIQEEDRGTLRVDEEEACHGVCQVATGV